MGTGHHTATLSADDVRIDRASLWAKIPIIGAVLAVIGLGATFALGQGHKEAWGSYLTAFIFFLSFGVGAFFFVMFQFITRAGWSVVVRRLAENIMISLPAIALLFVPIAFGLHDIFHWAHPGLAETDPWLAKKQAYLNEPFFYARSVGYIVIWTVLCGYFYTSSVKQDASGDHAITRRLQAAAAIGIALGAMSVTFAAFDWIMSLDYHWFSTIFGLYYFSGAMVGFFALLAILATRLRAAGFLKNAFTLEHQQDVGKLLFGFTVFWTYIGFSQYFLIWYANIPEETLWYAHRMEGGWAGISTLLAVGHFVIPFFFLMSRHVKRNTTTLTIGAVWMLVMHYFDMYWLVMPNFSHGDVHFAATDLTALIGVGGVFLAVVGTMMNRSPLIPVKDPRLPESLKFENF